MMIRGIDRSVMTGSRLEYVVLDQWSASNGLQIHDETIVISISEPGNLPVELPVPEDNILRQAFNDITPDVAYALTSKDLAHRFNTFFDESLAAQIADFLWRHRDKTRLVVHCVAGMSRSAGVVRGVASAFGDVEVSAACKDRYVPNQLVESLVQDAVRKRFEAG